MYTSSMAKKGPYEMDSFYNLRPLPSRGTRKRNPDEDFILRGHRTPARLKPQNYRTNSEMTITAKEAIHKSTRTPSKQSVNFQESQTSDVEFDPDDLALDLSEFADGPEEELVGLQDKSSENDAFLNSSYNSDSWFIKPLHRTMSAPVDIEEIARRQPLKASVLRSDMAGNVTSVPSEKIRKTPINDFDLSLFREAENCMLSSRTISALATPYQEELARLRLDRLRLEEQRLLKKKCVDELERIRGPKPRWYELKTPEFHREAKRNNDILSLSGHYEDIMEYRKQLLSRVGEEKVAQ